MNGDSLNISEQRKKELKQLFPAAFTETLNDAGELVHTIDFERLKAELGSFSEIYDNRRERYGMDWPGKRDCLRLIQQPSQATLKPCKEESVDFENTENLFIEGDNLEVLKLLQKSYYGQVKMIYIDPPYNTGKEFIYPDNFAESLDTYLEYAGLKEADGEGRKWSTNTQNEGRFHTKWLNMMYPRLYLARNLLRDDGVIFISIDDNEVENLRRMCDEIFGEENCLGTIVWKKKTNGNNMGYIPPVHDYILVYGKKASDISLLGFPLTKEFINRIYSNPDDDIRGPWTTSDLSANHEGPYFEIVNEKTGETFLPPKGRYWVFNETEVKKRIKDGRIIFGKSGSGKPVQKKFLNERSSMRVKAESWWDNHGMNEDGTTEIADLISPKAFSHPLL